MFSLAYEEPKLTSSSKLGVKIQVKKVFTEKKMLIIIQTDNKINKITPLVFVFNT